MDVATPDEAREILKLKRDKSDEMRRESGLTEKIMKLDSVKHIGIIGMGMIGDSMAVLTTGHGYRTTCVARRAEMIPEYKKTYDMYFQQMVDHGVMAPGQREICEKYLKYTLDYNELHDVDVIFECVNEKLELKQDIFGRLEKICPDVKVVCSASSSLFPMYWRRRQRF